MSDCAPERQPTSAPTPVCVYRANDYSLPQAEASILFRNPQSTEAHVGTSYFNTHFGAPVTRDSAAPQPYVREYQTHYDRGVVLSRLISAAAIHLAERGSSAKDLYLASGDGTLGLFAGALSDIREQVATDPSVLTTPESEPLYEGDFSQMTESQKAAAQQAFIEKHKNNLQEVVDRLHESVVNQALASLADIRLVPIPAGNGCDGASEYHKPDGTIPAPGEWTGTKEAYVLRLTIEEPEPEDPGDAPPENRVTDLDVMNYWGVGADAEMTRYLQENRERWKRLSRLGRFIRELPKAVEFVKRTKVTVDNERLASYAVVNTARLAKIIRTQQSHSNNSFDVVKESAKSGWLDTILSCLRLAREGAKGERATEGKVTLDDEAGLNYDGEYRRRLRAGTRLTTTTRPYPVRMAAAPNH